MSDLSTKDKYTSDSIGISNTKQSIMLPKSQPVRLKELMKMCENDDDDEDDDNDDNDDDEDDDDDDDDNNDEESEKKSENESDLDKSQSLSQDSITEDELQKSSPREKNDNSSIEATYGSVKSMCTLPETNREFVTNISYMQKKISCTGEEEYEVNDANFGIHLPMSNTNKQEIHTYKYEEKIQDGNILTHHASRDHQVKVTHSRHVVLPPLSLPIFTGDYNIKSDTNRNLQSRSNVQSYRENDYVPDILKKKEEYTYNTSVENKLLSKSSETYLPLKEEQKHKSVLGFTEQTSRTKDCKEESGTLKVSNIVAESLSYVPQTSGNLIYSIRYGSQCSTSKYEANEKNTPANNSRTEFSTPSLNETGKSLKAIANRLVLDTPMKHLQINSMHPNPCVSHKQLFCTPQSKLSNDPNKSHVQTPSTILSSCYHSNIRQAEEKSLFAKDNAQTPRNIIRTSSVEKFESSRFSGIDAKNVRRPLADAILVHGDTLNYPAGSKTLLLNVRPETKSIATFEAQENRNRKTIEMSDGKLTQTEISYDNVVHSGLRPIKSIEETKENKQCNISDASVGSDRKIVQHQNESKQLIIGSNTGAKVIQDSSQKYNEQSNFVPSVESIKMHEHYSKPEKYEEVRQIAPDKASNMQISVPTSALPQQTGKTLYIKDREYLIMGSLGRGMSGEVLRVQDLSCGEMRAIKCVDLSKMDKESAQGCLDEISMLRKLQASCVIKMFDYHIRESMVYVIMEMGDTDLSRLLKSMSQEKQIPFTMILYYWTEMLTAVKHIHDNGVIHSDLKPGNFLLVRGRLKLIDFGIASSINSDMTSVLKSNPIGTLNYISPEALMDIGGSADSPNHNKYKISFKSDVWSLGCILYSMVYGHTPFHHIRSQWAKVNAITNPKLNISFPVTTFSTSGGSQDYERAPPILIDVMRKCLQHDPKARPTVLQLLQVQYVPIMQHVIPMSGVPDIPANILVKIKHALSEDEWRLFIQVLDTRRSHT